MLPKDWSLPEFYSMRKTYHIVAIPEELLVEALRIKSVKRAQWSEDFARTLDFGGPKRGQW
jgi:hypothetical protein